MSSAILYRKGAAQLQVMVQKTLFCIIESPRLYKIFILYNYSKFKSKMQVPVLNNIKIAKGTDVVPFAIFFFCMNLPHRLTFQMEKRLFLCIRRLYAVFCLERILYGRYSFSVCICGSSVIKRSSFSSPSRSKVFTRLLLRTCTPSFSMARMF
jgi:hypothetical protein